MPPLILGEIKEDDLLVYKEYQNESQNDQIDIGRAIEIYSLSNKDDQVTISHQQNILFNMQEGNDKATIIGGSKAPNFEQFLNAEKVTWIPKDENGKSLYDTNGIESRFEFDVIEIKEDITKEVIIEDLISKYGLSNWEVNLFSEEDIALEKPSWLSMTQIDADPETLADGKIAIYTEIVEDADNNKVWLEIQLKILEKWERV